MAEQISFCEGRTIGFVVGDRSANRIASLLMPLKKWLTFEILGTQAPHESYEVPFRNFEGVIEASGYLRGLEREIERYDLIVVCDTSQYSSLQALESAKRMGKPCLLLMTEKLSYDPAKRKNLAGLEQPILDGVDGFILTEIGFSKGLPREKMTFLPYHGDSRFQYKEKSAQRFRKYVGLKSSPIVLFHNDLEPEFHPEKCLNALGLIRSMESDVKLIFAGQGSLSGELKTLSQRMGLAESTYFLHQDPEDFIGDLYMAADFVVLPQNTSQESVVGTSYSGWNALQSHTIPLTEKGEMMSELRFDEFLGFTNERELAARILSLLPVRESFVDRGLTHLRHRQVAGDAAVLRLVKQLAEFMNIQLKPNRPFSCERLAVLRERPLDSVAAVLAELEDFRRQSLSMENLASVSCVKGDILSLDGKYEEAISAYEEGLSFVSDCSDSLAGLGRVSLVLHANEDAMGFFRKSLAKDPQSKEACYGIALTYERVGLYEESLFWMDKAISLGLESEVCLRSYLQLCHKLPELEMGLEKLKELVVSLGPRRILMQGLAGIYAKLGQFDKASGLIEKYLESETDEHRSNS